MIVVVEATTPQQRAQALALRQQVLVDEMGLPAEAADDALDRDRSTLHVLVHDDAGQCVGTGRLTAPAAPSDGAAADTAEAVAGIGPIVVAPHARRRGIARAILAFLEEEALEAYGSNGFARVETWAPSEAEQALARVGFHVVGAVPRPGPAWNARAVKDLAAG